MFYYCQSYPLHFDIKEMFPQCAYYFADFIMYVAEANCTSTSTLCEQNCAVIDGNDTCYCQLGYQVDPVSTTECIGKQIADTWLK